MKQDFDQEHVGRFAKLAGKKFGLYFEESKNGFLAEILAKRLEETGLPLETYLARFEGPDPEGAAELGALAEELTVSETYFFRNGDQFRALVEGVLPERIRARREKRSLRILSAGCASGEEPYSIAILIRERFPELLDWELQIQALDLNPSSLARARKGRYSPWSLRETPPEIRSKWFRPEGRDFALADEIRAMVGFQEENLSLEGPSPWLSGGFDVVFCRNVLMYFLPQRAQRLVQKIAAALAPGGYLFLGHAETLRGLSHDFHLCHTHGTFYYQRKEAEIGSFSAPPAPGESPAAAGFPETLLLGDPAWFSAIQQASQRIETLAASRPSPLAGRPQGRAAAPPSKAGNLVRALEFLRSERYGEALACVDAAPPSGPRDTEALLLRAVLLVHGGNLREAEETCEKLLKADELNAGAHYVMALCREGFEDYEGAAEHDQIAGYLDSGFAMPRLHLGLLARRRGDREAARRQFDSALALLEREEPSRLLLFGGGFSREALTGLCRAELAMAGGKA